MFHNKNYVRSFLSNSWVEYTKRQTNETNKISSLRNMTLYMVNPRVFDFFNYVICRNLKYYRLFFALSNKTFSIMHISIFNEGETKMCDSKFTSDCEGKSFILKLKQQVAHKCKCLCSSSSTSTIMGY